MKQNQQTVSISSELTEAQEEINNVKLPEATAGQVDIVQALNEALTESESDTGSVQSVDFDAESVTRYKALFPVLSLPEVARTFDGAKFLKEWGKDRSADGMAFVTDRQSPVNFAFSLLDDPDETSEVADDNRNFRANFKSSFGLESTVKAALEALTVESNNVIEKTWWTDTAKGFKIITNGVGKTKDGMGKTVSSGQYVGKTVDTSGKLKQLITKINKAANHIENGKAVDSMELYLVLQGKLPARQDGTFDFFLSAKDAAAAIKARLYGLARQRAYKEAKSITDEIDAKRVASIKGMQERAQKERDEEREQEIRRSLTKQRESFGEARPGSTGHTSNAVNAD